MAPVVVKPAAGPKDFGVLAPDGGGEVDGGDGDTYNRAFGDCEGVDQFSGCCADRFRERQHIVFEGLHVKDEESTQLSKSAMTVDVQHALIQVPARGHGEFRAPQHQDREDS